MKGKTNNLNLGKVLGIPEVGVFDNFWDIGGDSIRSVRLIKELKEVGLTNIKLKDLFDKPTIAELLEQEIENNKVENLICMKRFLLHMQTYMSSICSRNPWYV